jgi:hypothetical protein
MMRVAIVGAAPSSRDLAPFHSPEYAIWTCSPSNAGKLPRVDAWFELHALADLRIPHWQEWVVPYCRHLTGLECPVYMQEKNDLVPGARVFPHAELAAQFGTTFLTSSIAWMIAFALREGAEEIAIYGVDMCASTEYEYERPGCQYFLAYARRRGIKIYVPPQSDLDVPVPLYGIGDANPMATRLKSHCHEMRARIAGVVHRLNELEAEKLHLLKEKSHLEGAIEENVYVRRTWLAWSGPDS